MFSPIATRLEQLPSVEVGIHVRFAFLLELLAQGVAVCLAAQERLAMLSQRGITVAALQQLLDQVGPGRRGRLRFLGFKDGQSRWAGRRAAALHGFFEM